MNRALMVAAVAIAAVVAQAATANDAPFPAARTGGVFVAAQTVTADGALSNYFAPGSTVIFRAYAVDRKTHKVLAAKSVRSFYVRIPGQPNVKLKDTAKARGATKTYRWTGKWVVPSGYANGIVNFRVLIKTKAKRQGTFRQIPVASSQLTITPTPQLPPAPGPTATGSGATKLDVALYADTVNGGGLRPIGCTQTDVFKRGEEVVVRVWGFDLGSGKVLTIDNVENGYFSAPGVSKITLNWGAHGAAGGTVWFWTAAWTIPSSYPLGDVNLTIQFKTINGKVGKLLYPITVIP